MLGSYIRMLRPWQWTKNAFVVIPLLFGTMPYDRYTFCVAEQIPNADFFPPKVMQCDDYLLMLLALLAFCSWSSALYVFNDLIDRKRDQTHERKRHRPIASGEIKPVTAACITALLAALPFAVLAFALLPSTHWFMVVGLAFLANGICYCLFFRSMVFLDVISIAIGFVLRVVAGCIILEVDPSHWIVVCTFTLALFLAFGKRKMESIVQGEKNDYRPALASYSLSNVNIFLGITAAVCLVSYLLYTLDRETFALHGTRNLIYTVPFVFYGIFRYVLATDSGKYDGPDEFLLRDHPIQLNIALWAVCSAYILWF